MELPKKVAEIETVLCRFHRYLRVAGKKDGTFLLNIIRKIKELNYREPESDACLINNILTLF